MCSFDTTLPHLTVAPFSSAAWGCSLLPRCIHRREFLTWSLWMRWRREKSFWKDSVQLSLNFVWRQNVGSFKTCFHSWGLITFAKNPPPTHTQLFRVLKRTPLMSWVTAGIFTVFPVHLACGFKQDWSETLWKIWHPKNLWEKLVTAKMVVQVWFSGEPGFLKSF